MSSNSREIALRSLRALPAIIVLSSLPSTQLSAQSSETPIDLPRHALVFVHHSDAARKDYDIWQIAADGSQMASVVVTPNHQAEFTISPDGDELIYVDSVDGKRNLWRRKFRGGEAVNITEGQSNDQSPRWSPDGNRLLFASDRDSDRSELYVMTLDSKVVSRLTNNTLHDSDGNWAPDGTRIIFTRYFPGDEQLKSSGHGAIFEYNLRSNQERQLTDLGGYCGGADYSPDGARIAFHRVAESTSEIWTMDSDGKHPMQITATFLDEYSPAWSPDGNWIAYTAGTGHDGLGTFDLWLMRTDGSGRRLVTAASNTQMSPSWRTGNHYLR